MCTCKPLSSRFLHIKDKRSTHLKSNPLWFTCCPCSFLKEKYERNELSTSGEGRRVLKSFESLSSSQRFWIRGVKFQFLSFAFGIWENWEKLTLMLPKGSIFFNKARNVWKHHLSVCRPYMTAHCTVIPRYTELWNGGLCLAALIWSIWQTGILSLCVTMSTYVFHLK